jgi:hypothetical protein
VAGQRGARSGVSIQRVRFALAAACGPIGAADLGHLDPGGLQYPGQPRTVAGGPFHPGDHDGPKALGPPRGVVVAGLARREFSVCQGFTGIRDDSEMVAVQMGVGADDDARRCCHDGGVPSRWLIASGWVTPGGARRQHIDEELPGS